jgi:hypothetical protein
MRRPSPFRSITARADSTSGSSGMTPQHSLPLAQAMIELVQNTAGSFGLIEFFIRTDPSLRPQP